MTAVSSPLKRRQKEDLSKEDQEDEGTPKLLIMVLKQFRYRKKEVAKVHYNLLCFLDVQSQIIYVSVRISACLSLHGVSWVGQ